MDEKSLQMLEFPKVLERLAGYAAFSASAELARALQPSVDLEEAQNRLACTSEARRMLDINADISIGGATDIRPLADLAGRAGVLTAQELITISNTLVAARTVSRSLEKMSSLYPHLVGITLLMPPPPGLIEAISRSISERGEVLDSASPKLAAIRAELKISYDRLMSRLERIISDPKNAPILQEAIITQRNGRYVVPLRADFKGRMRSIVHDQSASGATLFVEPLVIVELNNRYHELQLAERDEERRILSDLSHLVGAHAAELVALVEALARFDLALMCAKYAEETRSAEPVLHAIVPRKDGSHPGSVIKLYKARHPLLDPATVVPIDVDLDDQTFSLVITGPNTGGKTVTLKAVGLLALMAQSGLHIPVQSGSELSLFADVFADIGDEQSIEQSLSTFSGHITNITRILKQARQNTLVLLDELGAGTDPQEGSALARAILAHLVQGRIPCLIATHYPELKAFAHATPGVVNASLEFNLRTLRPTYHLTIGLPGRSNALAIADRLGLPKDIIDAARTMLNPDELRVEGLLDEIHRQRDLARRARDAAENARREAERLRRELALRLDKIEEERRKILEQARAEAEKESEALRAELDEVRRALARARQPLDALKPLQDQVADLQAQAERPVERQRPDMGDGIVVRPLRVGEKVRLLSLRMDGIVTALSADEAEVQIGNLRVRARLNDLVRPSEMSEPEPSPAASPVSRRRKIASGLASDAPAGGVLYPSPGMELDLRGQRAEDALDALDRYIESAFLAGLPFVRIIHGKGTGRLRQVIREALQGNAHVKRWENGHEKEGGDGVTVAHLHNE